MLTHEEIQELVTQITRNVVRNFQGRADRSEFRKDLSQELYLKAYALNKTHPLIGYKSMAKSLWRVAGDHLRIMNNRSVEYLETDMSTSGDLSSVDSLYADDGLFDTIMTNTAARAGLETEAVDVNVMEIVELILALLERQKPEVRTFIIAKLKLAGYIPTDAYADVTVDSIRYNNESDDSENTQIISTLLNMKYAYGGGDSTFKAQKRKLFLAVIKELNMYQNYRTWYAARYITKSGEEKIRRIKTYSAPMASMILTQKTDCDRIISIDEAE